MGQHHRCSRFARIDAIAKRNLGVLLYCEADVPKAIRLLREAYELEPANLMSATIVVACSDLWKSPGGAPASIHAAAAGSGFWLALLDLCRNYAPFGGILLKICDLIHSQDPSNRFVPLYRAVAQAQIADFPRATVTFEDALTGDPIDLLSIGQRAIETFLAAAVRHGRIGEAIEAIGKKGWKDAWRPIHEALRAAESGSPEYLKRVAVEIRDPASVILGRIAPNIR